MATRPLPLHPDFADAETYVDSVLTFATSCELFQRLCGGVHILDFFTKEPDLYSTVLPSEWRSWFSLHQISDILDLLMREDLQQFENVRPSKGDFAAGLSTSSDQSNEMKTEWRGHPFPPQSLLEYIWTIRKHSLDRTFRVKDMNKIKKATLSRNVSVGMKPKKIHEVENFAKYIDNLSSEIALTSSQSITHFVDFGSGQNYLGRALASSPYYHSVIAVESKVLNIDGAKQMDILAKLTEKEVIMRNKKEYRTQTLQGNRDTRSFDGHINSSSAKISSLPAPRLLPRQISRCAVVDGGGIQYVEHMIQDGDLSAVIGQIQGVGTELRGDSVSSSELKSSTHAVSKWVNNPSLSPQLMVISLHSCGNLVHHGIRSLILNPCVKAVSMVGCCYNLVTERLGPPTHKLPRLRSSSLRLDRTSSSCDPQGFPMSERLAKFKSDGEEGVRFNITARMMAVQAPRNWTATDCDSFFTRHFYRALLQRIFLDRGLVERPVEEGLDVGVSPRGWTGPGEPILIGSLRRSCYDSFIAYVRGALAKLVDESVRGQQFASCIDDLTDDDILRYEAKYANKKKELSIAWSLMAFSAEVVESIIVLDRWLFLREQAQVKDCWVEAVFDYKQSPRNLVVVGIKN
ncbi:hypothetical protein MMC07_004697 [Pseudocyphellaria aurata]|nr:hypothetical protein [Pseudocyphellaria aurata]